MALTNKQIEDIVVARAAGESYQSVAKRVGVAKQTAIDVCKEHREEVQTLKGVAWDDLIATERATRLERYKAHLALLQKLGRQIADRDLSDLSTKDLLDQYRKEEELVSSLSDGMDYVQSREGMESAKAHRQFQEDHGYYQ